MSQQTIRFDKICLGAHSAALAERFYQGLDDVPAKNPTAAIIVIGNEILSGRTKDKNIGWLAEKLSAQGIQLVEARVIADNRQVIIDTVKTLLPMIWSLPVVALGQRMMTLLPRRLRRRFMCQ